MDNPPDPEELLKNIQAEEKERGRLEIFLGYVAGVGKTSAMLEAAQKEQGVDVVVGYIETHQRAETEELVRELEVLQRKQVEYHIRLHSSLNRYLWSLPLVAPATSVGFLIGGRVEATNLVMIYLLAVVIAAGRFCAESQENGS